MGSRAPSVDVELLRGLIRDIPDFPQPGVVFKDITPLLADARAFAAMIDAVAEPFAGAGIDKVLGIEARGFIVAAPVADRLGAGFVPVRKAGKLPWQVEKEEYVLEYGTDLLEIHQDALAPGERALVVDDVMATGGTAAATIRLVEKLGGDVVALAFVIELAFLGGRGKLNDHRAVSLITYE
jgi:adenine phosphoribosyltransferase